MFVLYKEGKITKKQLDDFTGKGNVDYSKLPSKHQTVTYKRKGTWFNLDINMMGKHKPNMTPDEMKTMMKNTPSKKEMTNYKKKNQKISGT